MADCLIGLGSNLGDRRAQLDDAVQQICGHPQISLRAKSSYFDTVPAGGPVGQERYLNGAVRVDSQLGPERLLAWLQQVESGMGREPGVRWGPRSVDLDLLLYNQAVRDTAELVLPHPRMAFRRFVLEPAAEIGGEMRHATTGWTVATLLTRLREAPAYVALASADPSIRRQLAEQLSDRAQILHDPAAETLSGSTSKVHERTIDRPELKAKLGWIDLRFEQLASIPQLLADPSCSLVVSDYWFGQSLAAARTWFDGPARRTLEARCRQLQDQLPIPKLTLFLDGPAPGEPTSPAAAAPALDPRRWSRFCRELQWQTALPNQGPILRIPGGDLQRAREEFDAVLIAMQ